MVALESVIQDVISQWNDDCKKQGLEDVFKLEIKCRNKKFYLNKVDFYEVPIAEALFYVKGKPTLLLWRKEKRMPDKVKGASKHQVEEDYKRDLMFYFLYECIGIFAVSSRELLLSKDYCEYDIENDRLKQDDSAIGMVVSTLEDGEFYEKSQDFDVFMQTDDAYFVYTAHDIARPNNGVAKILKNKCLVKENAKQKIILLD